MTRTLAALLTTAAVLAAPAAQAQDIYQQIMNGTDPLSMQMQATLNGIVSQNVANPAVQQAYQQYLYAGSPYGQMSIEQFAYQWAYTRGFDPEATRQAQMNEMGISQRNQIAQNRYLAWQEQMRQAHQYNLSGQQWQNDEFGQILMGTQSMYDEATGRCFAVAYIDAGQPYQGEVPCPQGYPPPRY